MIPIEHTQRNYSLVMDMDDRPREIIQNVDRDEPRTREPVTTVANHCGDPASDKPPALRRKAQYRSTLKGFAHYRALILTRML